MSEHDAREAQTPEEMANDIMHEACLPQSLIDKGVHQAMYEAIRDRIREAADAAHAAGKAEGAAEERGRLLEPLGYDKNGEGLTSEDVWEDELVTICHNPYYDLEGVLIDLERQDADKVCLDTIRRIQMRLADVARRAREGGDSDG